MFCIAVYPACRAIHNIAQRAMSRHRRDTRAQSNAVMPMRTSACRGDRFIEDRPDFHRISKDFVMLAGIRKAAACAGLAACAAIAPAHAAAPASADINANAAPEFAGIDKWLNSEPLTLAQLRGKVVLVDFWTFACGNCVNTLPAVKSWHARYKDKGLVVVGVHTPE